MSALDDATLIADDWGEPIGLAAVIAQPGWLTRSVLGNTWAWRSMATFNLNGSPI